MKPRIIKRQWIVWVLLLLPLSAAMALPTLWPRLHPSSSVSDLYRRYEHNPHIRATEIHNFPINDILAVDALLLQATSDSAFYALLRDFGASEELIELYKSDRGSYVGNGNHSIIYYYIDKNNPQKILPRDNPDSRMVIGSIEKKSLCVFMTEDNNIKFSIGSSEIKKLKKQKNENQFQISSVHSSADVGRHSLPERK